MMPVADLSGWKVGVKMTQTYREIILGSSAIAYVKECLGNGRSFSHYILV